MKVAYQREYALRRVAIGLLLIFLGSPPSHGDDLTLWYPGAGNGLTARVGSNHKANWYYVTGVPTGTWYEVYVTESGGTPQKTSTPFNNTASFYWIQAHGSFCVRFEIYRGFPWDRSSWLASVMWEMIDIVPAISVTPSLQDYGPIEVGKTKDLSFIVANIGGGTLTGCASVTGAFSVVSGAEYALGDGTSQTVTVRYSPTTAGAYNQNVSFTGGGDATCAVSGLTLCTFTINPAYGEITPSPGIYTNTYETVITNKTSTFVTTGNTQFVCCGWVMTGNAPTVGSTNSFIMTQTNNAVLTWLWETNYWLDTGSGPNGAVSVGAGWFGSGSNVQISATASSHYHLSSWSGQTNGCTFSNNTITVPMTMPRAIMANFAIDRHSLIVQSVYGGAWPMIGTNWFDYDTSIAARVTNSPIVNGTTQFICTGWTGAGSTPPIGTTTNTGPFAITTDSAISWLWTTNFWLGVGTNGFGSVNVQSQWCPAGTNITIQASSTDYGRFVSWSGLLSGCTVNSNIVQMVMSQARTVTANFSYPPQKMQIKFSGYVKSTPLTNFPFLVVLDPSKMTNGFSYGTFASQNGYDLRFRDQADTIDLNYEVERWDTNGTSYVWVQVPVLTNNGSIWAYWGDAAMASVVPACRTNGAVWNANYKGVWHFGESTGDALDSTVGHNTGTQVSPATRVTGVIGTGVGLEGTNAEYTVNSTFGLGANSVTLETWAYIDATKHGAFIKVGDNNSGYSFGTGTTYFNNQGQNYLVYLEGVRWIQPATTVGVGWHHLAMVLATNGVPQGFVDGVSIGTFTGTSAIAPSGSVTHIGGYISSLGGVYQRHFNGPLDEVRVSSVPLSSDWIWATWMNVASNQSFIQYSAPVNGGKDLYGVPDAWKSQYFGGTSIPGGNAMDDWDHDGMPNYFEYLAGTNPTNWLSKLQITQSQVGQSGTNFVIRWSSITGKFYAVDAGTNLVEGFPINLGINIPATPDVNILTIRVDQAKQEFIRVRVQP